MADYALYVCDVELAVWPNVDSAICWYGSCFMAGIQRRRYGNS